VDDVADVPLVDPPSRTPSWKRAAAPRSP
jgi:hypothetical protein